MPQKMPQEKTKLFCPMYRTPAIKMRKKGWRIEFYYAENGKLRRHDIRVERYRRKFVSDKEAYYWLQENICIPLIKKLRNGWTPRDSVTIEEVNSPQKTIQNILDEFEQYNGDKLDAKQITGASYYNYIHRLETIRQTMRPEYSDILPTSLIEEVTTMQAEKYILRIKALREWEAKTANNFIKFWRMIYKYAIDCGYIDRNPFEKVSLFVGEEKSKRILTQDEQTKICNYLLEDNLPFFIFTQLVYIEGIRPCEILRLQVQDLDAESLTINIPATKTKNHKARSILIAESLKPIFMDWLNTIDFATLSPITYLFHTDFLPAQASQPLKSNYASKQWKIMRNELNISEEAKLYGLRHTGITDLLNIFSVNAVRMHIGHATAAQTLHYAKHENELLQKEIAAKAPMYGINVATSKKE